ncbi:MAG: hypothetical protein H6810_07950 [Phycisphaeraceae bacterium]|nr:MAG: hypothetical protein H6810_07950 [Phycisphaeraceae bacterium]
MRTRAWTTRRGVTFVEVVLGVALLGLVAATLAATVGAVGKSFQRQRDRLGAVEVASRLLLQRVDDEAEMPSPADPVGYGDRRFRFKIEENPTIVSLAAPAQMAINENERSGGADLSRRFVAVTVTTWLAEDSGGSFIYDPDLPSATLTRVVDPLAFSTYDSAQRRLDTQEDIERFLNDFVGTTSGTVSRPRGDGTQGGGGRGPGQTTRPPGGGTPPEQRPPGGRPGTPPPGQRNGPPPAGGGG